MPRTLAILLLCLFNTPLLAADLSTALDHLAGGRYEQAVTDLNTLAVEGNAEAQYTLGMIYSLGQGVAEDQGKALEWLSEAARGYHYEAANTLGKMYLSGTGVAADQEQALYWMNWAAKIAEATKKEDDCE